MAPQAACCTAGIGSATSSNAARIRPIANLLWTGDWDPSQRLPTTPVPTAVLAVLRALPSDAKPMDALRTAVSAWGATQDLPWPPTVEQARALTAFSPSALAAFARLRSGKEPVDPDP